METAEGVDGITHEYRECVNGVGLVRDRWLLERECAERRGGGRGWRCGRWRWGRKRGWETWLRRRGR